MTVYDLLKMCNSSQKVRIHGESDDVYDPPLCLECSNITFMMWTATWVRDLLIDKIDADGDVLVVYTKNGVSDYGK